jgi:hypothetical protein
MARDIREIPHPLMARDRASLEKVERDCVLATQCSSNLVSGGSPPKKRIMQLCAGTIANFARRDQVPQRSAAVCTGASHRAFAWPSSTDTVTEAPAMSRAVT